MFDFIGVAIGILFAILIISGIIFLIGYAFKSTGVKISFDIAGRRVMSYDEGGNSDDDENNQNETVLKSQAETRLNEVSVAIHQQ